MNSKADIYLRQAAEFAAKAEAAVDTESRKAYRTLAESYCLLSGRVFRPDASDAEIEALARRMVAK